ncbi:hypothetical protein N7512_000206 [Penicillium capsulatum]|nr:hypothetical protein N7512_000206 [Penicillium capsulatum]
MTTQSISPTPPNYRETTRNTLRLPDTLVIPTQRGPTTKMSRNLVRLGYSYYLNRRKEEYTTRIHRTISTILLSGE